MLWVIFLNFKAKVFVVCILILAIATPVIANVDVDTFRSKTVLFERGRFEVKASSNFNVDNPSAGVFVAVKF